MAVSQVDKWTVVVVVEEDDSLTSTYRMLPSTRLSELLEIWKNDFELFGLWKFVSASEEITLHDHSVTLEVVGETVPRIVNLRAKLIDEPVNEIFVYMKDNFYTLSVEPDNNLHEILWRLPVQPKFLGYNGSPLNVMNTIQQAGIKNKTVIYESLISVSVKLSSGYTKVFQIPSNGMVLHLKEKVNIYEINDFSLTYQGRHLKSDESVRRLTQVVEVTMAQFVVNFKDKQHVSWITKDEPITVSDFVSQLAVKAKIDTQKLDMLEFVCVGCQRQIRQSEDYIQHLPVECCEVRSLTLDAVSPSYSGTPAEDNDVAKRIQSFHEHLMQCRLKGSRRTSCGVCRRMMEKSSEKGQDYNIVMRWRDNLLMKITELEDKIKKLEIVVDTLKTKNFESEKVMDSRDEVKQLKKEYKTRNAEGERLVDDSKKLVVENTTLRELYKEIDKLHKEIGVNLLIIYFPGYYSPVSLPGLQGPWQVPWKPGLSYIKHQVRGIRPGSVSFEEVRDALQQVFNGPQIKGIRQCLGSVAEGTVTWVFLNHEDDVLDFDQSPYCGIDGTLYSWEKAGKPEKRYIRKGDNVFLCGSQTTVLQILKF